MIKEGLRTALNNIRETSIVDSTLYARYVEESFSTYDSESKRLSSRIKSSLMIFGDSAELAVSVLDGRKDGYYNKNYKFYYNVDKIVVYQIENDKFFNFNKYSI